MEPTETPIGIVGLGLMGSSITVCLLIAGHPVIGVEASPESLDAGRRRILDYFQVAWEKKLMPIPPDQYLKNLTLSVDYGDLARVNIVIESVKEDFGLKKEVFERIGAVVAEDAIITTNTSAIPITDLQAAVVNPGRFFGLHWMQPAHTTRFLEVICGEHSDPVIGDYLYRLGEFWGKECVLVKKDIRGFIGNRLMYSMYREALHLVEGGYASVEDVDRACRNVAGYFIPMVGVFRWMDFTGIGAYHTVMKELFPTLSNAAAPNDVIGNIVKEGGNGIFNGKGFYEYSEEERKLWLEAYTRFSYEVRDLVLKYPHDVVKKELEKGE